MYNVLNTHFSIHICSTLKRSVCDLIIKCCLLFVYLFYFLKLWNSFSNFGQFSKQGWIQFTINHNHVRHECKFVLKIACVQYQLTFKVGLNFAILPTAVAKIKRISISEQCSSEKKNILHIQKCFIFRKQKNEQHTFFFLNGKFIRFLKWE